MEAEQQQTIELVNDISKEINQTDFHVPKFITGVECATGTKEYDKILKQETTSLAKEIAKYFVKKQIAELQKILGTATTTNNNGTGKMNQLQSTVAAKLISYKKILKYINQIK